MARLHQRLTWVDQELSGKDCLMGSPFTVADACLFTVTNRSTLVSLDISGLQQLQACHQCVGNRPAVQVPCVRKAS